MRTLGLEGLKMGSRCGIPAPWNSWPCAACQMVHHHCHRRCASSTHQLAGLLVFAAAVQRPPPGSFNARPPGEPYAQIPCRPMRMHKTCRASTQDLFFFPRTFQAHAVLSACFPCGTQFTLHAIMHPCPDAPFPPCVQAGGWIPWGAYSSSANASGLPPSGQTAMRAYLFDKEHDLPF